MRVHAQSRTVSRFVSIVVAATLVCALVPAAAGAAGTVTGLPEVPTVETTEWFVDPVFGADTNAGTSWDGAFKTIAAAVNAADQDDLIHLAEGTYSGQFPIDLGADLAGVWFEGAGAGKTILDAGSASRFFTLDSTEIVFEGITFSNGAALDLEQTLGGALWAINSLLGSVDCEFDTNYARFGGAICSMSGELVVVGCDFHDNGYADDFMVPTAQNDLGMTELGGAIYIEGHEYGISDSSFDGNTALVSGAAVSAAYAAGEIDGCTFTNNESIGLFAGLENARAQGVDALRSDPLFGSVVVGTNGVHSVTGCTFSDNLVFGAPLLGMLSDLTAEECDFTGNEALVGGVFMIGDPSAFYSSDIAKAMGVTPKGTLVESVLSADKCVVTGNDDSSVGMAAIGGASYIANTLIADNANMLGGIVTWATTDNTITNVTIADNDAMFGVANMLELGDSVSLQTVVPPSVMPTGELYNSIIWDGSVFSVAGMTVAASDLITGTVEASPLPATSASAKSLPTNISKDPLFVSPDTGDYRLVAGSPCIDTGMDFELAPADDLDGLSRPVDGDDDTVEQYDMGAYEFFGNTEGRIWGENRYQTAVEISKDHFASADTVVLATGRTFADGLAASGLAGVFRAPLLLTETEELPAVVSAEIERLGATRVIVTGGTSAVAASVATTLKDMGLTVERIGGVNRYSTAALIAKRIEQEDPNAGDLVFLARGDLFADALTASPVAYTNHAPILLVRPDEMPEATVDVIEALGTSKAIVVGGTAAVSSGVAAKASALTAAPTKRISGANRYDTSAKFSEWAVDNDCAKWNVVGVATGLDFPDALSGGAGIGTQNGVLLLTPKDSVASSIDALLSDVGDQIERLQLFGGVNAVDEATKTQLMGYVD